MEAHRLAARLAVRENQVDGTITRTEGRETCSRGQASTAHCRRAGRRTGLWGAMEGVSDPPVDRGFVLVLDNAHVVSAPVLSAAVAGLLERLDPQSEIAVASRTEPALPTGRLRAHRRLVEVRTADLTMTSAEAA